MHRTIQQLRKEVPEIRKYMDQYKKLKKEGDKNKIWFFQQDVIRQEILSGIMAGNFYDFDEACNIANYFDLIPEDWSVFGCPAFD